MPCLDCLKETREPHDRAATYLQLKKVGGHPLHYLVPIYSAMHAFCLVPGSAMHACALSRNTVPCTPAFSRYTVPVFAFALSRQPCPTSTLSCIWKETLHKCSDEYIADFQYHLRNTVPCTPLHCPHIQYRCMPAPWPGSAVHACPLSLNTVAYTLPCPIYCSGA